MILKKYWKFDVYFSGLGNKPNIIQLAIIFGISLFKHRMFKKEAYELIARQWRAHRFPEDIIFTEAPYEPIELLSVVAGKDILVLPQCLSMAIRMSLNPINQITLVVPRKDIKNCSEYIGESVETVPVKVVCEEDLINEELRIRLKNKYKNRYGWVLQQLLADEYVLQAKSKGILLINADTVLLREIEFLEKSGRQLLMVCPWYHRPYYELLQEIIQSPISPRTTHVTHHMLFQPEYMREIFQKFQIGNISKLADIIISLSDDEETSPLCVEFELYAQGMLMLHPEKIILRKFSNKEAIRSLETNRLIESIKRGEIKPSHNSLSMHSYLE